MSELLTPQMFVVLSAGLVVALVAATRPIAGLLLAIVTSIAVDFATHNLALVGMATGVIVGALSLTILQERRYVAPGDALRQRTPLDGPMVWLMLLTVIYAVVGMARGNSTTHLAGDVFHLLFEIVFPYFLVTVFLKTPERLHGFMHALARVMLVLSVVILVLYFTGILQKFEGAGNIQAHTRMFRIRYTHHYPLFPLLLLMGYWFYQRPGRERTINALALGALLLVLGLTLKRTFWGAGIVIMAFYFFMIGARAKFRVMQSVFATVLVLLVAASVLIPQDIFNEAELQTYTRPLEGRFTSMQRGHSDKSLANRFVQIADGLAIFSEAPLGHGLGSEFFIRFSAERKIDTHYIHNGVVHYLLQMGVAFVLVVVVISWRTLIKGFAVFRALPDGELKGVALGALGSFLAILITSATEVTFNTFFFPITAAILFLAHEIGLREGLIRPKVAAVQTTDEIEKLPFS